MASKQTSTRSGRKTEGTKKAAKQRASTKSTRVKTVDIELSKERSKKSAKTAAASGKSGKKTAAAGAPKKRSGGKQASAKTAEPKKRTALQEKINVVEEEQLETLTPTPEALRAFRKASAHSRQLAKRKAAKTGARQRGFLRKVPKTGKRYSFDLRVHSPGTDGYFSTDGVDSAQALVRLAKAKGLDMIGITDHYNAAYIDIIREAAEGVKIRIIPGLDLRCRVAGCDEVYFVALFPEETETSTLFHVLEWLEVPENAYGRKGYCIARPFETVLEVVEGAGGFLIPCHVDKTPYRQLAITPLVDTYGFHVFDLVHPDQTNFFRERWPSGGFSFLSFSNANSLAQVGTRIAKAKLSKPGFEGILELARRKTDSE